MGYAIGKRADIRSAPVPPENVRAIPLETDVEVFYSPSPKHVPAATRTSRCWINLLIAAERS